MKEEEKDFLEKIFKGKYNWFGKISSCREFDSLRKRRVKGDLGQEKDIFLRTMQKFFTYTEFDLRISFSLSYYCEKVGNDFDPVFFFWFHIEVKDEYRRFGREKLYEKYFTKEDEDVTQWLVDTFFEIKNKAQQLPVSISNVLPIDFESIERFL